MSEGPKYDAASIVVLEGLEAVRRRPLMYVGPTDHPEVPVRLLRQALCHAIDCAMDEECTSVDIVTRGRMARVSYDAGMPLEPHPQLGDTVARLFLTLHAACRNLKKHIAVGEDLCDLGLAVLNAFCDEMEVTTNWRGLSATYLFRKGREVEPPEIVPTEDSDSTVLRFYLDREILGSNVFFDAAMLEAATDQIHTLVPQLHVSIQAEVQ